MRYKWLNKEGNNKLILFFNGWGMDEGVVKHLDCEAYDILMFYDYNTLDTDFDWDLLNIYSEKNLIAWSMGVMVCSCLAPSLTLPLGEGLRVAINGTLKPIDEEYGIHPKIYDLTIKGFNEKGRDRFIDSMFYGESIPHPIPLPKEREICEQHSELIALKEICNSIQPLTRHSVTPSPARGEGMEPMSSEFSTCVAPPARGEGMVLYNKVFISNNDKIIPTKSQIAFWEIEPNLEGGHCPFFQFKKWSELL